MGRGQKRKTGPKATRRLLCVPRFVTEVEAQAYRSQMGLQSAAGIKHAVNIVGT
jgi:hypothetical protein